MNRSQYADLHGEEHYTRHDATLDAAMAEHKTDVCPECGATWPSIVGTRYGYKVVCSECDYTIEEVEL